MHAVEYDRYGPSEVLNLREVPDAQLRPGTVLVRVTAVSVNPKDTFVRKGRFRLQAGRSFPKRTGYDASGIVAASGAAAFATGDRVFGMLNGWSGGAAAELVAWPADELAAAPRTIPLIEAAAVPLAASTALQALRDHLAVKAGQSILINGASGGVGSFAVQIARTMGARVTAICGADRLEHVAALGADAAHDYACGLPSGRFDGIFDVFGNLQRGEVQRLSASGGRFVTTVPSRANLRAALAIWRRPRTRIVNVKARSSDLALLAGLIDAGKVRVNIDRCFSAADAAAAHRHVEGKHTKGKVLLVFAEGDHGNVERNRFGRGGQSLDRRYPERAGG